MNEPHTWHVVYWNTAYNREWECIDTGTVDEMEKKYGYDCELTNLDN